MKKDNIIQLVGFITHVDFDEFVKQWDYYSRQVSSYQHAVLLREETQSKTRYNFVSQHEVKDGQIRFMFMKGRNSEYFADQKVKVVHMGGYQLVSTGRKPGDGVHQARIMIFQGNSAAGVDFLKLLPHCRTVNTYQAYYESCTHDCIVELLIPEIHVEETLHLLQTIPGIETTVYRECLVPQV